MIDYQKAALTLALVVVVLLIARALLRSNRSDASQINLEDLLIGDDGKTSKAAAVMFGAFGLSTWILVNLTVTGRLTEGYFTAYLGAWVAPTVARLIFSKPTDTKEPPA